MFSKTPELLKMKVKESETSLNLADLENVESTKNLFANNDKEEKEKGVEMDSVDSSKESKSSSSYKKNLPPIEIENNNNSENNNSEPKKRTLKGITNAKVLVHKEKPNDTTSNSKFMKVAMSELQKKKQAMPDFNLNKRRPTEAAVFVPVKTKSAKPKPPDIGLSPARILWYFVAGKSNNYFEAVWSCFGFLTDTSKEVLDLDEITVINDVKNELVVEYNIELYNKLLENPNATISEIQKEYPEPIYDAIVDYNSIKVELWSMRIVGVMQSIFGIVFMATVIAIIVDLVREKLDQLKEGKSIVVETNHIIMLGWTDKSINIISELADANSSEGGTVIVVLTEVQKEAVEKEVDGFFTKAQLMGTKVVVRRGSALQATDLMKISIQNARAIIILSVTANDQKQIMTADQSDAATVQTILSIKSLNIPYFCGFIVCEMRDADNQILAEIVGGEDAEVIVAHDIIGRLMVMSSEQTGLSKVYDSILGFEGDEFYIQKWPELSGKPFGSLLLRFPDAIVFGVRQKSGKLLLNPPHHYKMAIDDELIVIAEDNDTYKPKDKPEHIEIGTTPKKKEEDHNPVKILLCGWRRDIRDVIKLLDDLLPDGSEIHMLTEMSIEDRTVEFNDSGFFPEDDLANVKLIHYVGSPTVRRYMQNMQIEQYKTGLIFSDEKMETDILASDSLCISALLLIRDIQQKYERALLKLGKLKSKAKSPNTPNGILSPTAASGILSNIVVSEHSFPLVCEILDPRTQKTIKSNAAVSEKSDFIQSNDIISKMIAMVVENREVKQILDELLGAEGNSISVRSSSHYCFYDESLCFFELALRAQAQGQILIGYQLSNGTEDSVCNPKDKLVPKVWAAYDMILLVPPNEEKIKHSTKRREARRSIDEHFMLNRGSNIRSSTYVNARSSGYQESSTSMGGSTRNLRAPSSAITDSDIKDDLIINFISKMDATQIKKIMPIAKSILEETQ